MKCTERHAETTRHTNIRLGSGGLWAYTTLKPVRVGILRAVAHITPVGRGAADTQQVTAADQISLTGRN